MAEPAHLVVGHVNKAHGTKGEVFVWPLTDNPGYVFAPGVALLLADPEGHDPDPDAPRLRVESARDFRRGFLVRFGGVDTRDAAESLKDRYLMAARTALPEPEEGELFYHQLLGLRVERIDGGVIGRVREVYELRPRHMLEVFTGTGTVLIPLAAHIVRRVDVDAGVIVVDPPEGLLDL